MGNVSDVEKTLSIVKRSPDIRVKDTTITCRSIDDPDYAGTIGNKTLGRLAFLKTQGYTIIGRLGTSEDVDINVAADDYREK